MWLTVLLVVLAALANVAALVLLRKASQREPAAPSFSLRQLWTLLHRPVWAGRDGGDLPRIRDAGHRPERGGGCHWSS